MTQTDQQAYDAQFDAEPCEHGRDPSECEDCAYEEWLLSVEGYEPCELADEVARD